MWLNLQDAGITSLTVPHAPAPKPRKSFDSHSPSNVSDYSDLNVATPTGGGSREERWQRLASLGMPPGLAKVIDKEDGPIRMRFFILDNSASTMAYDGKYFETAPNGDVRVHNCTRWEEIKRCALSHAVANVQMGTPCEFMLLNPGPRPLREGVAFVRIDEARGDVQPQMRMLKNMLQASRPRGVTPLVHCLRELHDRIELDQNTNEDLFMQHVFLVIITDGVPTAVDSNISSPEDKGSFMSSIRALAVKLPVHVVIRLCTDDPKTISFYNDVETELELPLDVIDDFESEAQEVYRCGNNWFVYTLELHRLREGGTFIQIFDILDERQLTTVEATYLAQMLLCSVDEPSLPREPQALCDAVEYLASGMPPVYDVRSGRNAPMVNHKLFWSAVLGGDGCPASRDINCDGGATVQPPPAKEDDDLLRSHSSNGADGPTPALVPTRDRRRAREASFLGCCQRKCGLIGGGEDDSEAIAGVKQIT